jgi:GNAT superfamily N-acetyltransferase
MITLAEPADLPDLPEIERRACELFRQLPLTAALPLDCTPDRDFAGAQRAGRLWVARLHPHAPPVGFALVTRVGDEWHLQEMDVLPEHGRRGLGRALLAAACEWVRAQGGSTLTLTTFRDVPWNAPFYERCGFRRLADHELTPALRAELADEAAHGLPPETRVAMRWGAKGVRGAEEPVRFGPAGPPAGAGGTAGDGRS